MTGAAALRKVAIAMAPATADDCNVMSVSCYLLMKVLE
jgi:hypothetical protein